MNINNVSFAGVYNTREIANVISGKEAANTQLLASLSGVSTDVLQISKSADLLAAGSNYCISKIVEDNPEFKGLRAISLEIKKGLEKAFMHNADLKPLYNAMEKRDEMVDEFCAEHGETIEIPEFDIPFLTK